MGRIAPSIFATLLLGAGMAQAAPEPRREASLHFDEQASPLSGLSYGLDAVDGRRLILDDRKAIVLDPGQRVVAYSCPGARPFAQAQPIHFEFEAGTNYELVCHEGRGAEIVVAKGC